MLFQLQVWLLSQTWPFVAISCLFTLSRSWWTQFCLVRMILFRMGLLAFLTVIHFAMADWSVYYSTSPHWMRSFRFFLSFYCVFLLLNLPHCFFVLYTQFLLSFKSCCDTQHLTDLFKFTRIYAVLPQVYLILVLAK